MSHEEEGKFSSMVKGLEMEYVGSIPITDQVAENIRPEYFKDPFLVAKTAFSTSQRIPQFEKKNVFGSYKIQTARERELEMTMKNKRNSLFNQEDENSPNYNTPRNENKFQQSLIHPSNEIFDTKFKEKPKGASGVSIMSGEINKINKL